MGKVKEKRKCIFETEAGWSDASKVLLCLDSGSWRTERPSVKKEKCNRCGVCVLFCPPQCMVEEGEHFAPNLDYCKGCGVCAKECPKGAIIMVPEGECADGSAKKTG